MAPSFLPDLPEEGAVTTAYSSLLVGKKAPAVNGHHHHHHHQEQHQEEQQQNHGLFSSASRPLAVSAHGHHVRLEDGREILDACGGAAVACLGYGRADVVAVMAKQAGQISYAPWGFFENASMRQLSDFLIRSTGGAMSKVYVMSSGTFSNPFQHALPRLQCYRIP
jgi:adenosylmethionine-8-amino-7-oxononanoate aminotransferase